ncbi:nuclear speckle splicing regulatory protein 1 isoform X2 [Varanus komodoensis]|uniref:nuclear speckle splicing regulatory protein 1 isoform X2 n=1 Tax=Varanus komodoensis TaxID=61221 RepID=UPI001CF76C67|nr:nuclear speckle splicing regulatory protein 1 isoform X2 [Varanus komodoensis]
MAAPSRQYGLIFPKKAQKTLVKHAVFMDDSDEETKLEIQRALAEDSTVYEYDNIYDDIQQKKAESHASFLAGKGEKKPKYIQNILKAAELRKKEQEKRMEKKIQKEREMEGGAFDDKEAFVTSAYKKKLQERAEEEEREKREAAMEACLDVTKQKDLSGFYRHLLNQTVGEEEVPKCSLREARLKEEEEPSGKPASREASRSPIEPTRAPLPPKGEGNPDADSDPGAGSGEDDSSAQVRGSSRAGEKKEHGQAHSKHRPGRRGSRSPSEERSRHARVPARHPEREDGSRKEKGGSHRERERERRHRGHDREEHPRAEDSSGRQEERDDRQRRKDRKERDDYRRELREERDREDKYSEWEQQVKGRPASHGERDRGAKEDRSEKRQREWKNSSPGPLGDVGEERKGPPSDSERSPELRHKEGADQEEKPLENRSKFAKRSNVESVTSARDRYLARLMARAGAKPYVEKEED